MSVFLDFRSCDLLLWFKVKLLNCYSAFIIKPMYSKLHRVKKDGRLHDCIISVFPFRFVWAKNDVKDKNIDLFSIVILKPVDLILRKNDTRRTRTTERYFSISRPVTQKRRLRRECNSCNLIHFSIKYKCVPISYENVPKTTVSPARGYYSISVHVTQKWGQSWKIWMAIPPSSSSFAQPVWRSGRA